MSHRLVLAAAVVVLTAAPVLAGDEPATTGGAVTMVVDAGLSGYVDPEAPVRVSVELTASALTLGTLELVFGGTVSTTVEVPAGSVKRYDLDGPPPLNRRQLVVRLESPDGVELASETIRLRIPADELLVGVVGNLGIDTALRSARSTPMAKEINVLAVGSADAGRLAPLAYIVTGPGGLADFDAEALDHMNRWIEEGGRLYGPATEVNRLAAAGSGVAFSGTDLVVTRMMAGEVGTLESPADVTVDEWSRILRDRPGGVTDGARQDASLALVSAASSRQDASVPALPWLLAGIVVFVLLVGPANFLVLRSMSKPEWAWVTVPVLSVVFLTGFWVIGRAQLADFSATHAAVVVDSGGQTNSRAGVVVQVESAGDHVMGVPEGWRAIPTSSTGGRGLATGDVSDDGVTFALDDLGVGTVELAWADDAVPLAASMATTTLSTSSEALEVEVVNESAWTLWSWGVVVNGFGFNGPDELGPGASGTVVVRSLLNRPGYEPAISEAVSRRPFNPDRPIPTYEVVLPLALFAEQEVPRMRDTGAFLFGFTDDRDLEVVLDGRPASAPGTTLLVKQVVIPDGAAGALGGVRPEILEITGASSVERYGDEIYAYGAEEVYFHYEVPISAPDAAEINPSFTALDDVAYYDWVSGEFAPFMWGEQFAVAALASPSGEVVIRARVPADSDRFFDESISLGRFAMRWAGA